MKIESLKTLDKDARDFLIDGNLKIHIKRNEDGYSIDIMDSNGWVIEENCVFDEDLNT